MKDDIFNYALTLIILNIRIIFVIHQYKTSFGITEKSFNASYY